MDSPLGEVVFPILNIGKHGLHVWHQETSGSGDQWAQALAAGVDRLKLQDKTWPRHNWQLSRMQVLECLLVWFIMIYLSEDIKIFVADSGI